MRVDRPRPILSARHARRVSLNDTPPRDGEPQTESLPRLILRLFARRWPAYAALAAGLFAADALFHTFVRVKGADLIAALIFSPLFDAAAILIAAHDAREDRVPLLSRLVDRAWAVVVVEFIATFLEQTAQAGFAPGSGFALAATLLLTFCAMLVYSPVDALLSETESALLLVPLAFANSLRMAWQNISRVFALFSIVLTLELITGLVMLRFDLLHRPQAAFWATTPIAAAGTIVVDVIVTAAYVDLLRRGRKRRSVL